MNKLIGFILAAILILANNAWTSSVVTSQIPPGAVFPFAGSSCPVGYLAADGSSLLRAGKYAKLFAAIGTAHGTVDGTHFSLPDLRGEFVRGDTSGTGGSISLIASNNATVNNHGFVHTGFPVRLTGSVPTGLSTGVTYYVIYIDANTIAFASSQANAYGGVKIAISGTTGAVVDQYVDPDTSLRVANALGGNASGVGSYQDDMFKSHTHTTPMYDQAGTAAEFFPAGGSQQYTGSTNPAGGNETRSKNIYLKYCVKY
jgi:microcystin-dependent protein